MVVLNAEIMPKFEGKSAKSVDSTFKLFGRTIAVKNSCDNSSSSIHVDGIPAEAVNAAVSKASETRHDEKQKQNEDSEKLGKKPTKPVPCPRCESMDTKFCYFNNYNVNQPRHYCRRCQRYWTAGGSLRNVPVGAGRRKNKPCFGIQHRQIMEDSEILWNDGQSQTSGRNSDKLVKVEPFYPEFDNFREGLNEAATPTEGNPKPQPQIQSQFDDYSYPSTVNLPSDKVGKELLLGSGNEVGSMRWPANSAHLTKEPANSTHLVKELESAQKPSCSSEKTQRSAIKAESAEPVDDLACDSNPKSEIKNMSPDGSSSSSSSSMNFIGSPWPVYYNGSWGSFPPGMESSETNRVPWYPPGTGLLSSVSWPLPSAVMWGIPWMPGNASSESKTLGKHQREETTQEVSENKNRSLWVPKTLRMDDREEAARSSFLTNLGLENKEGSINSGGILKGFQSKMDNTESTKATPLQVLCANPAALSRSSSFLESS